MASASASSAADRVPGVAVRPGSKAAGRPGRRRRRRPPSTRPPPRWSAPVAGSITGSVRPSTVSTHPPSMKFDRYVVVTAARSSGERALTRHLRRGARRWQGIPLPECEMPAESLAVTRRHVQRFAALARHARVPQRSRPHRRPGASRRRRRGGGGRSHRRRRRRCRRPGRARGPRSSTWPAAASPAGLPRRPRPPAVRAASSTPVCTSTALSSVDEIVAAVAAYAAAHPERPWIHGGGYDPTVLPGWYR